MRTISRKTPVRHKRTVKRKKKGGKRAKHFLSARLKIAAGALLLVLLSPFYYGYIVRTFSATVQWIKNIGEDPDYRTYDSFNIAIPMKYNIHGIDVSSYQGQINWRKVKEMQEEKVKIHFAFIKATEGLMHVDPYFQRNWREAPKAGIICGAYHYLKPQKSGLWQARFFLQNVRPEKGDLPMVVDIEELGGVSPEKMRSELLSFIKHIEKKTGVKPIIYTNLSFYNDYLRGYVNDYYLWIAHYYKAKLKVGSSTNWRFWQHTDKATIDGVNHVVDMNVFNGDSLAFRNLLQR